MLKSKSKILLVLSLALVLASSYCFATVEPTVTEAETTSEEQAVTISEEEAVTTSLEDESSSWTNSDLYLCQDKVEVSNVVDGNAFIIGKEVTISGEIGGDLFVLADKLNIDGGYVYSNLFACVNEITVNGVVYDIYAACNTFNLESNGFVYRDMKVVGSNININGKVRRNAQLSANTISFVEGSETLIYGNLKYSANSEIAIPEGVVAGTTTYNKTEAVDTNKDISTASIILNHVLDLLKTLLYTLVITLILLWLTPKFIEKVSQMSVKKSLASLGIGFVAFIAFFVFIFVGIFLLISTVGTPVFILGMFASILVAYIGNAIASIFFGKLLTKLFKMEDKDKVKVKFILFTLLAALIIWAISLIPFVGSILSFLIWIFGIGTLLVNMFNKKEKTEVKE